ncbi:hypothetical protein D1007_16573 [Hordeum vulgare]|uniref:Predicted protein n=1 Tax=Hordeum vulgare subsp. vulgare TaxID=112509 RepID=F2E558_HORVV|nr:uncharacterized protein LOC123398505 [Hordeum vulgare subsp. vulgare]KAE8807159.1 hypothetical protein D1007_16573 [Hordeum vulgare]BAK02480.1 predicted protein [Hordeum vulgare subsp. vulgare]
MATKGARRGRRRRSNGKPSRRAPRREPIPPGPTGVHHIPDHLLELVLLRVGSSLALLRAAFACKRWRRIVAAADFLAQFRSIHAAHVPGHYHVVDPSFKEPPPDGNSNHVYVPDPSTADAIDRRHLALDFLPEGDRSLPWELGASRGGQLLLYRRNIVWHRLAYRAWYSELYFSDMVVCDPLTRTYQTIRCSEEVDARRFLGVFLLDGIAVDTSGGGFIAMSNFRVLAVGYESHDFEDGRGTPRASVFSSGSEGGWQSAAENQVSIPEYASMSFVGRARSSLYWRMEREGTVLALDETTLEFSLVEFPCSVVGMPEESSAFRVIGGHDGAVRVVCVMANNDLTVFAQLRGSDEWVAEKLVRLPEATCGLLGREETYFQRPAKIVSASTRYILVTPQEETWIVSVDLETLKAERAHERIRCAGAAYPFELPWPPALQACRAADRRRSKRIYVPPIFAYDL